MRDSSNLPLVSILTPSYNQAAYLADALHSVACQTHPRIEHIVMDGGSSDGTVGILREAGGSITWRSEPDGGQCEALNKAFALSSGDIIGWLNSDDAYFDCGVVERVVEVFATEPAVDVVYGHAVRTSESGKIVFVLWVPRFNYRRLRLMNFLVQPTVFIRRRALGGRLVDERFDFTMDWELWLRLGTEHRFKRVDSILAIDRQQPLRKNITHVDVFRENEVRLRDAYCSPAPSPAYWRLYQRWWWIRQRVMGGFLVASVARERGLAFRGGVDSERELLRRQVFTRMGNWAPEDRSAF